MPDNSFDIVSKIDLQEVANAIQQAMKEVGTRFDLKDSKSQILTVGAALSSQKIGYILRLAHMVPTMI